MAIEVNCAATVTAADFSGLRELAQMAGRRFRRGIVLYADAEVVPSGSGLIPLLLEALWHRNGRPAARKTARA